MSKPRKLYQISITIGVIQYRIELSTNGTNYLYTIARVDEKDEKVSLKEIHKSEYLFKPFKKQARTAAYLIAAPDAKKHQPVELEKKEETAPKGKRKPLLT